MSDPHTSAAVPHGASGAVEKAKELASAGTMGFLALVQFIFSKAGEILDQLGPGMSTASEGSKQAFYLLKKFYLRWKALWSYKVALFWIGWITVWQWLSALDIYAFGWNGYVWKELVCWGVPGTYVLALYFVQEGLWKALDLATKLPEKVVKLEILNENGGFKESFQAATRKVFTTLALACCFRIMDHTNVGEALVLLAALFSFINAYRSMKEEQFSVAEEYEDGEENKEALGTKLTVHKMKISQDNLVRKFGGAANVAFLRLMQFFRWTLVGSLLAHMGLFLHTMNVECGESNVTKVVEWYRGYNPAAVCYNSGTDTVENAWMASMDADAAAELGQTKLQKQLPQLMEEVGTQVFGTERWTDSVSAADIPNLSKSSCLTRPDSLGNVWVTDACLELMVRGSGATLEQAAEVMDRRPYCMDDTGRLPEMACMKNFIPTLSLMSQARGRMKIATNPKCFLKDGTVKEDCLSYLARYRMGMSVDTAQKTLRLYPMDTITNQSLITFMDSLVGTYKISYSHNQRALLKDDLGVAFGKALKKQKEEDRRAWVTSMTSFFLPDGVEQRIKEGSQRMLKDMTSQHLPDHLKPQSALNDSWIMWGLLALTTFLVVMGYRKWQVAGAGGMLMVGGLLYAILQGPLDTWRMVGVGVVAIIAILSVMGGGGDGKKGGGGEKKAAKKDDHAPH